MREERKSSHSIFKDAIAVLVQRLVKINVRTLPTLTNLTNKLTTIIQFNNIIMAIFLGYM